VVRQQVEAGINVVNDGEFGRISWLIYAHERLSGFEQRPVELKDAAAILKGKDRADFADYYAQFASRSGLTYYKSPGAPLLIADLINECVLDDNSGWHFKSHMLHPVFMSHEAPPSIAIDTHRAA
jgi:hypothetical protein